MDKPYIVDENENFAVIFKPPGMHCVPPGKKNNKIKISEPAADEYDKVKSDTLFEWCSEKILSVFDIIHRLDYETRGLVLFAKNKKSYEFFKSAQDDGNFIKEYTAICSHYSPNAEKKMRGFPPAPSIERETSPDKPIIIESFFRPFGPGRKQVRPVINDGRKHKETAKDRGGFYKTEILNIKNKTFTVRIKRGFRHQIRCHLCWIGFSILNDPLYFNDEPPCPRGFLALGSNALFFPDPENGAQCEFRIPPVTEDMLLHGKA